MDKLKGKAKEGWDHRPIHRDTLSRDTLKSGIKGKVTGKKNDPYEAARNHQSRPLTALKDPDSFGPPPRHTAAPPTSSHPASPSTPSRPQSDGWGRAAPAPSSRQQVRQEEEEEAPKPPPGPYKVDTSGLRTDNLPKPPVRRVDGPAPPATPPRSGAIASPPPPTLPSRQPHQQAAPAPFLPPRMTENPDEYTPPPPPTYNEAVQPGQPNPATLNQGALNRLGQAGISVPGFGIGQPAAATPPQAPASPQGHTGQLSELQQRFARMNAGSSGQPNQAPSTPAVSSNPIAAIAHKKPPPPPPPKRAGLGGGSNSRPSSSDAGSMPPPLPLSSKPRPLP